MSSFMRCALLAPLIMMASVSYGDKLNAETQVNIVEAESSTIIGGIDVAARPLPSGETKPAIHNEYCENFFRFNVSCFFCKRRLNRVVYKT